MEEPRVGRKRYPPELKERAVRMVLESFETTGERFGVITRVARQLGIGAESLRKWVERAEVDGGRRAGTTTRDQERIKELNARCVSYGAPTRSSRQLRLSSRRSSTRVHHDDEVHRGAS